MTNVVGDLIGMRQKVHILMLKIFQREKNRKRQKLLYLLRVIKRLTEVT